jgi:hypothetical protein
MESFEGRGVHVACIYKTKVKAHYDDPFWGTFPSTIKSIFCIISQNVVHLILSLNFSVLVLKF